MSVLCRAAWCFSVRADADRVPAGRRSGHADGLGAGVHPGLQPTREQTADVSMTAGTRNIFQEKETDTVESVFTLSRLQLRPGRRSERRDGLRPHEGLVPAQRSVAKGARPSQSLAGRFNRELSQIKRSDGVCLMLPPSVRRTRQRHAGFDPPVAGPVAGLDIRPCCMKPRATSCLAWPAQNPRTDGGAPQRSGRHPAVPK